MNFDKMGTKQGMECVKAQKGTETKQPKEYHSCSSNEGSKK